MYAIKAKRFPFKSDWLPIKQWIALEVNRSKKNFNWMAECQYTIAQRIKHNILEFNHPIDNRCIIIID